jgi:hypothetical protein
MAMAARSASTGIDSTLGELQIIRAEAQNWLRSIRDLNAKATITDPEARSKELDETFQQSLQIAQGDLDHVRQLLASLEEQMTREPRVARAMGDELTHIANAWNRAEFGLINLSNRGPRGDTILPPLVAIKDLLDEVVRRCGFLTIPSRVNEHLGELRMGQGLDFNATFEDELPEADDRSVILKYLHDHPAAVNGVVDVGKARIFRASSSHARRLLSVGLVLLVVVADYGVLWLVSKFTTIAIPAAATDPERWPSLWHALTAALAGGLAHILVGAIKQSRERANEDAFLAIDDLLLWVHVREVQLAISVASFLVAISGLVFVLKTLDVKTAFFVGYSLDSFVDIFLERFEKTSTAQVASITNRASSPN